MYLFMIRGSKVLSFWEMSIYATRYENRERRSDF